jgi:hypothetical protein
LAALASIGLAAGGLSLLAFGSVRLAEPQAARATTSAAAQTRYWVPNGPSCKAVSDALAHELQHPTVAVRVGDALVINPDPTVLSVRAEICSGELATLLR